MKLFIFDMDGVLLDSETLYRKINFDIFDDLGVEITDEEYRGFIGISARLMWDYIKEKGNLPQDSQTLMDLEKDSKYEMLQNTELEPNEGIPELLEKIKVNDYHLALASSSPMKNVKVIVEKLGFENYFEYLVSGDMIENGKPAPDIFLNAANHFHVPPQVCAVIEDSRNGTLAADAAGMTCVGYENPGSGKQDLSKADFVIDSFHDVRLHQLINNSSPDSEL